MAEDYRGGEGRMALFHRGDVSRVATGLLKSVGLCFFKRPLERCEFHLYLVVVFIFI